MLAQIGTHIDITVEAQKANNFDAKEQELLVATNLPAGGVAYFNYKVSSLNKYSNYFYKKFR